MKQKRRFHFLVKSIAQYCQKKSSKSLSFQPPHQRRIHHLQRRRRQLSSNSTTRSSTKSSPPPPPPSPPQRIPLFPLLPLPIHIKMSIPPLHFPPDPQLLPTRSTSTTPPEQTTRRRIDRQRKKMQRLRKIHVPISMENEIAENKNIQEKYDGEDEIEGFLIGR